MSYCTFYDINVSLIHRFRSIIIFILSRPLPPVEAGDPAVLFRKKNLFLYCCRAYVTVSAFLMLYKCVKKTTSGNFGGGGRGYGTLSPLPSTPLRQTHYTAKLDASPPPLSESENTTDRSRLEGDPELRLLK